MSPLNVFCDPIEAPGVISSKLWIKEGSRADPKGQKGIHQLLGSLLTRGCGPYDNIAIADLVEGCGAGLRCDTHEDGLLISLKCASNDADQLLPLLGWMIIEPHIVPSQIELEKELSIQALQRQKENPFHLSFDGWRKIAYEDGPYGHDPLGESADLKKLCRNDLIPIATSLSKRDSVLVVAGSIDDGLNQRLQKEKPFENLINPIKEKDWPNDSPYKHWKASGPKISLEYQSTEQVVLMLGQPTIPHGHKQDLSLRLLNTHLGCGMSSLLFRRLREENGVAYEVGAHYPAKEYASPFLLHASTSEEKASTTLQLLTESWWELIRNPISESEFSLAKAKFRGQLAQNSQTTGQKAERKAQLKIMGLANDYDKQCLIKMDSLTVKDLQKVAEKYLQNPLLSLCGQKECIQELSKQWERSL